MFVIGYNLSSHVHGSGVCVTNQWLCMMLGLGYPKQRFYWPKSARWFALVYRSLRLLSISLYTGVTVSGGFGD